MTRARRILLVLAALVALALPYALSSFWVGIATQALFFGLFALSINLLGGFGGMITLGQAGLLGVAGYGFGILTTKAGLPLGVALVAALAITVAVSAFFGLLLVRARDIVFVMITLAQGMIVWGISQRWQELTGGDNGLTGLSRPGFAAEYWQYYYFVLAIVAICTFLVMRLVQSPFGLSLKGIREAEDRLESLGYNVGLHKLVAITISGTMAGIAGLLLAMYNTFFGPKLVFVTASVEGLMMSIVGGIGTLSGAFVGSTIVVLMENEVSSYVSRWQTLLGILFVIVILVAPDGLVGAWTRLGRARLRRMRRWGEAPAPGSPVKPTEAGKPGP